MTSDQSTQIVPVTGSSAEGIKSSTSQKMTEAREGTTCNVSRFLLRFYAATKRDRVRKLIRTLAQRFEKGPLYSNTIREILRQHHSVDIGLYTVAGSMEPGIFSANTTVGRYSTIYHTVRAFSANHPMNTKSTHPFFYNPLLGKVKRDIISRTSLTIGSDVWIGHNAIILNNVNSIGDGAVIGAGAVLSTNVPPYAVVTGCPARTVRMRFSAKTIEKLLNEKWWLKSIEELGNDLEAFGRPLEDDVSIR